MKSNTTTTRTDFDVVSHLSAQAEDLSHDCKSLIEIVAEVDIQRNWFINPDQEPALSRLYPVEPLIALFLYKHARGLSSQELIDWLITRGETKRFNLPRAPSQPLLSRVWQHHLDHSDREAIRSAARHFRVIHVSADSPD